MLKVAVVQALFTFTDVRPFCLDDVSDDEVEEDAPALCAPSEIRRLLKSPRIVVPRQGRREGVVLLLWGATWDGERGVEFVLVDSRIEEVRRLGDERYCGRFHADRRNGTPVATAQQALSTRSGVLLPSSFVADVAKRLELWTVE